MESQLIIKLLAFLSLAIVASHAVTLGAADAISYWKSELPNTAMPQAIKDSLSQTAGWVEEKGTSVGVGKGGVNVNTGKGKPGGGTRVNVGHGGVGVHAGAPGHRTNVGVGKGGVYVGTPGKHGKPVVVNVKPGSPFLYQYAATEDQLHDDPNVALFFKPTALHKGNTMTLHFTKTANDATFLPRSEAEKIPFSSQKMSQILNQFSIAPDSEEAQVMKQTITECEEPVIKGEEKQCATSLESMVDFSKSKLGKKVRAISTAAGGQTSMQKYTISGVQKIQNNDKAVVCHKQNYAYAVFYCHKTQTTEAYTVSLVGANGAKVKAAVVCHKDTSAWNPKHLAFQVLKIKPGTVPVCHFLPEDHIVWVAN
nr:BURP domain protein RD22-like [Ipomoea batatas]GME11135.1 BURP domain protein RD22-like [Ipomoea batatas]